MLESGNKGISVSESLRKLEEYGKNEVQEAKRKTPLSILLHQLTDFMVIILIIASVISGFIGEITDTIIILAIVVLNTIVGFIQEYRAEKAIEALKKMSAEYFSPRITYPLGAEIAGLKASNLMSSPPTLLAQ